MEPLIANIYLHRFDVWFHEQGDSWHDKNVEKFHNYSNKRKDLGRTGLKVGIHVRYSDDILMLCKDCQDAERFKHSITKYMTRNMKLAVNEMLIIIEKGIVVNITTAITENKNKLQINKRVCYLKIINYGGLYLCKSRLKKLGNYWNMKN